MPNQLAGMLRTTALLIGFCFLTMEACSSLTYLVLVIRSLKSTVGFACCSCSSPSPHPSLSPDFGQPLLLATCPLPVSAVSHEFDQLYATLYRVAHTHRPLSSKPLGRTSMSAIPRCSRQLWPRYSYDDCHAQFFCNLRKLKHHCMACGASNMTWY
jgi:hypothetical protein